MFQIPENILNKLKCSLCDGYLNAKPVVLKNEKQICAKCFKILPHAERGQCVRQISFEAIGSCLIFPCRYHKMGCDYTFSWDNENGHEIKCKKKYFTFPDVVTTDASNADLPSQPSALKQYQIQNNSEVVLEAATGPATITGNTNAAFNKEIADEDQNCININLEGTVNFNSTKATFSDLNYNNITYENIYSTISNPTTSTERENVFHCLSCNVQVDKSSRHRCLFGHISCNNCKSDMCIACVKNLDGNSRTACKNASKGCQKLLHQNDIGFHRDNCDYNEIMCPFDICNQKYIFEQLVTHLKENHASEIITSNDITKNMGLNDQSLIFLCHDGIFKCLYYWYYSSIEIIVIFLGPCVKASEFYYEISVEVNKKTIKKKQTCANWNNYMLTKGLIWTKDELLTNDKKHINLTINLKIMREK